MPPSTSTGRLPLFALAVGPGSASAINDIKDLEGHTVAVSGLGNADHTLLLYLLEKAGADKSKVAVAQMGTNLFDALRVGHVEAAMVQEPALTLITEAGGKSLVNFMDLDDANRHLGGPYSFMAWPCAPPSASSAWTRCAGWRPRWRWGCSGWRPCRCPRSSTRCRRS